MDLENFNKICRTCTQQGNLISLFSHNNLKRLVEICSSSEIDSNDELPKQVCQKCFVKLRDFCIFRDQILYHDGQFRELLTKTHLLEELNTYENNQIIDYDNQQLMKDGLVERNGYQNYNNKQPLQINNQTYEGNTNLGKDNEKAETATQVLCEICGKLLSSQTTLTHHLRIHSGQKPFTCSTCNRKFSRSQDLKHHTRIHTGEKPHRCQVCAKTFTQVGALLAHNRTHSGEKPHVCSICSKTFAQSITLTYHIRTHTGEAPYECELCGKCFTHSGNLNVHRRFHNNERPFQCDLCPKSFVTVSHLKVHVNQHNGVKRHSCNVCQKAFVRSTHLKEHMVVHTGERRYICGFCPKRYSQSGHLQRHIKKNHSDKDEYG
ncbi:hypothetical protein Trydic_g18380 [Trypoxylus dichotomus]